MKILIIEDNENLAQSLSFQLNKENFEVDICDDGKIGLMYAKENAHDLILLDRLLPSMDGLSILKEIRKMNISTPVIMITALGEINDKITGLDSGADDYIVKPFEFDELMARIRCINRRSKNINNINELTYYDITLIENQRQLICNNNVCSLSKKETALFNIFIKNPNIVLSRSSLLNNVWGISAEIEDGNLDNYIYFLRRRLKSVNSSLTIKTIRSLGYKLELKDV